MSTRPIKTILIISQVYLPDPAAVGMQIADAAAALVDRGYRVRVLTANRGYDDPSQVYATREVRSGVEILRLPLSSFGKRSIASRLLSGLLFVGQASVVGAFLRGVDGILVTTAPPMCALAALVVSRLRRAPVAYWVMDLNPDQMVALGRVSQDSLAVSAFDYLNRRILSRSALVVAMDEFMAERLRRKVDVGDKLRVLPPWPHDDHLESVEHTKNPFRKKHRLDGKFVVMYSGNHGPSSPVTTCLDAAALLEHRPDIVFLFVGGGVGKEEVEAAIRNGASNVRSLPYQPLESIKYSLSAADVHLVTVGDAVVGIVHPSKIYGAMSIGRPILLTAPTQCHATSLVAPAHAGYHVNNGDAVGAARAIEVMASMSKSELAQMAENGRAMIRRSFSREMLRTQFVDLLVSHLNLEVP